MRKFNPSGKTTYSVDITTTHKSGTTWSSSWAIIASSDGTAAQRGFSAHRRDLGKKGTRLGRIVRAVIYTRRDV